MLRFIIQTKNKMAEFFALARQVLMFWNLGQQNSQAKKPGKYTLP